MDPLTHALSGAVIGTATSRRDSAELRQRALWGGLFAMFPDIDIVMVPFTDHFTYLNEHRGITHSIIMLPVWAALLGWLAARFSKQRWRDMAALAAAALAAHILGDLITSYGTKVFAPVNDAPLAFPITFIIDPVFTLILLAGLFAALWKRMPASAAIGGLALCAYLLLQAFAQQWATRLGVEYAAAIGAPDAPVIVFPQPLSPFNWKIIVATGESYRRAYVNLLEDNPRTAEPNANILLRVRAAYQPADALNWKTYPRWPDDPAHRDIAIAAWLQDDFAGFRRFALLPYVSSMRGGGDNVCVWFTDLRFTLRGMPPPFEYAMCRNPAGIWALNMNAPK
ncbi:MAG TPA: metal-dependent hydrolase [Gammaproteobacteria bacterium]